MICQICGNETNNIKFILREMMFGFRDKFDYFQCANCECMQISSVPKNIDKYYPNNYYSFNSNVIPKFNWFNRHQFNYLAGINNSLIGKLISYKYKSKEYFEWIKNLGIKNKESRILDIGCGSGDLLKKLYSHDFKYLRGIDPFIKENIEIDERLKIFKQNISDVVEKFDFVMMHHSLEHMPNQEFVLQNVFNILSNDGKFLLRIPIISEPLMKKYGTNVVSLDPPRHFYIHSLKSIEFLVKKIGFKIKKIVFDTEEFDLIASEQYTKDIGIYENGSYVLDNKNGLFSANEIVDFKKYIEKLNNEKQSSSIALYLTK